MKGEQVIGTYFSKFSRLESFKGWVYLTLMDPTHCTNKPGWKLFTVMVRTENTIWLPYAYLLAPTEDSDIVS